MQLKHIFSSGIIKHMNFRGEKMQLPLNVLDCYYSMMYRFRANNHTVGYAIVFKCTEIDQSGSR